MSIISEKGGVKNIDLPNPFATVRVEIMEELRQKAKDLAKEMWWKQYHLTRKVDKLSNKLKNAQQEQQAHLVKMEKYERGEIDFTDEVFSEFEKEE